MKLLGKKDFVFLENKLKPCIIKQYPADDENIKKKINK